MAAVANVTGSLYRSLRPQSQKGRWMENRDGHFVTQRPSDPGIQRPGDPVDPVTLF